MPQSLAFIARFPIWSARKKNCTVRVARFDFKLSFFTNPPFTNPCFTNPPFTNPLQPMFYNMPVYMEDFVTWPVAPQVTTTANLKIWWIKFWSWYLIESNKFCQRRLLVIADFTWLVHAVSTCKMLCVVGVTGPPYNVIGLHDNPQDVFLKFESICHYCWK